jgi:hypothetical protein
VQQKHAISYAEELGGLRIARRLIGGVERAFGLIHRWQPEGVENIACC